jgi:hypothetical protein
MKEEKKRNSHVRNSTKKCKIKFGISISDSGREQNHLKVHSFASPNFNFQQDQEKAWKA